MAPTIRSDTKCGFNPTAAQLNYLRVLTEALATRTPSSDTALCTAIGISRMTLWKWRQSPDFVRWLHGQIDQTGDFNWSIILRRQEVLALQGNLKSAEFVAKVRFGAFARRGQSARRLAGANERETGVPTVRLLIPRPE